MGGLFWLIFPTLIFYLILISQACRAAAELVDETCRYGDICAAYAKHMIFAQQVIFLVLYSMQMQHTIGFSSGATFKV